MPNHGTTLLVILQAWILPCSHGFTYTPFGLGSSSAAWAGSARHTSFTATQPRPLTSGAAVSGGTPLSLSMVDGGGGGRFDPSADEVRLRTRFQCSTLWLQLYG